MKRFCGFVLLIIILCCSSCYISNSPYKVGSDGPAGGIIFYDKGKYSDGWRYLEAAPKDLSGTYGFGYYRFSSSGTNKVVGTSFTVGSGKENTKSLVEIMGSSTYLYSSGTSYYGYYAAIACYDYTLGEYNDWFLPSKEELALMYTNLKQKNWGSFASGYYWSSTESNSGYSYYKYFYDGSENSAERSSNFRVRPIRSF